ncbi:prepilin peptidase [Pseudonocardia sp. RS11V-5]|uniref:prepilin peptidase n=1 Tax=Pseudonocardia terrae TaxID=2905831 RepID=UPI001E399E3C|nr:prepilin peptidase [Pseudonocardia terrae]MCE3553371.1 prepilin peptidase [Pseudonocardia terrae]
MTTGMTVAGPAAVVRAAVAAGVVPGGISPGGYLPSGAGVGWAVLGFGLGMLAGAAGRVLLGRLRRGTHVAVPWLEVAVGVPWAVVVGTAGSGALAWSWAPLLLAAGWLAVVAGVVDLRHHRLPDALTLPALPAALLLAAPLGIAAVGRAAAGAALLAGMYLLTHTVSPRSLGLGDVKLAAPVGALLTAASWPALLVGCALTAVVSAAVAGFLVVRSVRRPRPRGGGVLRAGPPDPVAPERSDGSAGAATWRRGARPLAPPAGPPAELPLGPPMLGSAWLVVFVAALMGGVSGAVGTMGGG